MASILNVDQINNAAGTSAISIDGSGNVNIPGHIIQVLTTPTTTSATYSTTGWSDVTGMNLTITPSSSSSKILVFAEMPFYRESSSYAGAAMRLVRGSTAVDYPHYGWAYGATGSQDATLAVFHSEDSPATTSAVTYKVQVQNGYTVGTIYLNTTFNNNLGRSRLTLMEIAQ